MLLVALKTLHLFKSVRNHVLSASYISFVIELATGVNKSPQNWLDLNTIGKSAS